MPPAVITIVAAIEMLIRVAPGIADVVKKAKDLIASLFTAKIITKEEQDALMARVDQVALEAISGSLPEWWTVEPDPEDDTDA